MEVRIEGHRQYGTQAVIYINISLTWHFPVSAGLPCIMLISRVRQIGEAYDFVFSEAFWLYGVVLYTIIEELARIHRTVPKDLPMG